jgi:hypothetical protein
MSWNDRRGPFSRRRSAERSSEDELLGDLGPDDDAAGARAWRERGSGGLVAEALEEALEEREIESADDCRVPSGDGVEGTVPQA